MVRNGHVQVWILHYPGTERYPEYQYNTPLARDEAHIKGWPETYLVPVTGQGYQVCVNIDNGFDLMGCTELQVSIWIDGVTRTDIIKAEELSSDPSSPAFRRRYDHVVGIRRSQTYKYRLSFVELPQGDNPEFDSVRERNLIRVEVTRGSSITISNDVGIASVEDVHHHVSHTTKFSMIGTPSNDSCSVCGDSGYLLCCGGCEQVFHFACVDPPVEVDSRNTNEDWFCSTCVDEQNFEVDPPLPVASSDGASFQKAEGEAGEPIRLDVLFFSEDSIKALGLEKYGAIESPTLVAIDAIRNALDSVPADEAFLREMSPPKKRADRSWIERRG